MHSVIREHSRFYLVKDFYDQSKLFPMPNFIGHNWPIKMKRGSQHLCVPLGGIISASFSSLQSLNTPLGSIRGQTDVAVAFCATVSRDKP